MSQPKVLRVGYPLSFIQKGQILLDPTNTDSVYQFYLLENLAAGLVRDSSQSPLGYEPGLARAWEKLSPTRWAFDLNPDLSWSDGTKIDPRAIAEHLQSLARDKHRHVVYLRRLKKASVEGRRIVLEFDSPVNDGLIHELSLADAALLHPKNLTDDWSVVSGAFFVESFDPGKRLLLRRNSHYAGSSNGPDKVEFVNYTMDTIGDFFDKTDIDLLKIPTPAFRAPNQKILSHAPQVLKGYPTWIYYLHFNPSRPLGRDAELRRSLAALLDDALKGDLPPGLTRERQLVPKGYSGHLDAAPSLPAPKPGLLRGRHIKINLLPSFGEAKALKEALAAAFTKAGATLELGENWGFEENDADAQLSQFSGNQRDAMGSWQFMFSPDHGDLAAYRPQVEGFFEQISGAENTESREAALRLLHARVLKEAYAVPLFIEADSMVASKRVDLSRLNPFDMRLRFYEVQWK